MKTNFLISPVGSQKVGRGKENSKTLSRMTEIPSIGKGHTKILKASLINKKYPKHPSVDQKLPRKLPGKFKSLTKSPVKYSIMEGLSCESEIQKQPPREL